MRVYRKHLVDTLKLLRGLSPSLCFLPSWERLETQRPSLIKGATAGAMPPLLAPTPADRRSRWAFTTALRGGHGVYSLLTISQVRGLRLQSQACDYLQVTQQATQGVRIRTQAF